MTHVPETDPTTKSPSEKLSLSFTQILGSVFAAVSATVIASFFGVAGTVIGAALGSLVSVVGSAVYTHSMNRTRDRIRIAAIDSAVAQRFGLGEGGADGSTTRLATAAGATAAEAVAAGSAPQTERRSGRRRFDVRGLNTRRLAVSAGALFVLVLGGVTAFELASGQPLSSTVTAKQGTGTSLGGGRSAVRSQPSTASTATSSSAPSSPSSAGASATAGAAPTDSSGGTSNGSAAASPGVSSQASTSPAPTSPAPTGSATGGAGAVASSGPLTGAAATSAPSPIG